MSELRSFTWIGFFVGIFISKASSNAISYGVDVLVGSFEELIDYETIIHVIDNSSLLTTHILYVRDSAHREEYSSNYHFFNLSFLLVFH
jgi:hypothetical protein